MQASQVPSTGLKIKDLVEEELQEAVDLLSEAEESAPVKEKKHRVWHREWGDVGETLLFSGIGTGIGAIATFAGYGFQRHAGNEELWPIVAFLIAAIFGLIAGFSALVTIGSLGITVRSLFIIAFDHAVMAWVAGAGILLAFVALILLGWFIPVGV